MEEMIRPHTTRHELDFLNELALYGFCNGCFYDPFRALNGYLIGATARNNWDGIDKHQVIAYAKDLVNKLHLDQVPAIENSVERHGLVGADQILPGSPP